MIKALIFDFDGVLVSSELPRYKYLQSVVAKYGVQLTDADISKTLGKTTLNFLREIIPDEKIIEKLIAEFNSDYLVNITKFIEPIDFTINFIRNYKENLPLAIASMSSHSSIEKLTRHFGIYDKITCIVGRNNVIQHKPDPEIYLKTASLLQIDPQDCLVFEDTVIGVKAALSASMSCCVVLNGLNKKEDFDGIPIKSFVSTLQDLEEVIKI